MAAAKRAWACGSTGLCLTTTSAYNVRTRFRNTSQKFSISEENYIGSIPARFIHQPRASAAALRVPTITTPVMTNAVPANCTGVRVSPNST